MPYSNKYMSGNFKPTIGLEIHCELKTKSKMFCRCANNPQQDVPNKDICPICTGHPGTLPTINEEAVKSVIKAGYALNCHIPKYSKFDRKNYFYPDLPKGYQISQHDQPLCENGWLIIDGEKIRISRIHLEEDAARNIHKGDSTLIDYNRAGVPLMELVSEPDIKSGAQARKFAQELQLIFRYLGISDANMEKGQMRIEVNVSISNNEILGTKVEIKNIGSISAVERAIEYEVERQSGVLLRGEKISQETRGWDDARSVTTSQRSKEGSSDYRYFPEPDLPILNLDKIDYAKTIGELPELPQQKRVRLAREYGLNVKDTEVFVEDRQMGEYFEKVASEAAEWAEKKGQGDFLKLVKLAANYIITDYRAILGEKISQDNTLSITPENFAELVVKIYKNEISSKIAKIVLLEMHKTGNDPSQIIESRGLNQISDFSAISVIAQNVIKANSQPVSDYKAGQKNALQFLIGQVMKESGGKASPDTAKQALEKLLDGQA